MTQSNPLKSPRIDLVDALRGLAILGIMLLHNIEHFNLYRFPEPSSPTMAAINTAVWDFLFFVFSGKSYAIFALLFGFSFYVQYANRQAKGEDYCWRFVWRMVILSLFGWLNATFFAGDILILYAMVGVVLLPVRKVCDKALLIIAIALLLQPMEWGKFIYAYFNPEYTIPRSTAGAGMYPALMGSSFIEAIKFNVLKGEWWSLDWSWNNGRVFQTAGLFMTGLWLGRKQLFVYSENSFKFWKRALIISAILFIPLYYFHKHIPDFELRRAMRVPLNIVFLSFKNMAFMFVLVSAFCLLWFRIKAKGTLAKLAPYGKMSLTNYVVMGIVGSVLYYGYGFALYKHLGITMSLVVGIVMFTLQLWFSRWWLKTHRQGPFEYVWAKLTWIGSKK